MVAIICLAALLGGVAQSAAIEAKPVTAASLISRSSTDQSFWTPADFDWNFPTRQGVVYMDVTDKEMTSSGVETKALVASGAPTKEVGDRKFLGIATAVGLLWQAANIYTTATTIYSAVNSCRTSAKEKTALTAFQCANGVLGSLTAFGGLASVDGILARHGAKGVTGIMGEKFKPDILQAAIEFADGFTPSQGNQGTRRSAYSEEELIEQHFHHALMTRNLRRMAIGEPEFLGYLEEDHFLSRRDFALHPLTPSWRYNDKRHGMMEFASRSTANGTFVTLASAGHPTHLLGRAAIANLKAKRQADYETEIVTEGIAASRFDVAASQSDTNDLGEPDEEEMFGMVDDAIQCYTPDNEEMPDVLSAQFYDNTNRQTFAFSSSGFFANMDDAVALQDFEPQDLPLPVCGS